MEENIVLIGFMGTGKTSLGKQVATRLNYEFLDTDQLIETQTGLSIPAIFEVHGEAYFRRLESEIAVRLSTVSRKVISTGGGFPLNPSNIDVMRRQGFVVLLQASPEVIYHRVKDQAERPLLMVPDPLQKIRGMLKERESFYRNADFVLNTDDAGVEDLSNRLIEEWKRRGQLWRK
jgi:shikimate kinase